MSPAMASTKAPDSHRHGCRTGIALIVSGRCPACEPGTDGPETVSVTWRIASRSVGRHARGTDGVVLVQRDVRACDGAVGDIPVLEDVAVVAVVVDQVLDSVHDRLLQRAALHHGDAIWRHAAGLAPDLELAVRLFDLVIRDGLVEPAEVGPAREQRRVGVGLGLEAEDLDVLLARVLAIVLVTGDHGATDLLAHVAPGVALLGGARLHGDAVAAHVGAGLDGRASEFDHPGFTGLVVSDEVDAAV